MKYPIPTWFLILFASLLVLTNCQVRETSASTAKLVKAETSNHFKDYWYQGMAEVNSYHLMQSRYGELRQGDAILVFVTEDFSRSKQVKLDNPSKSGEDKIPVLKLNSIRKFKTGVYDYSMMQSVFTPVNLKDNPNSLKTTVTSQEWCGHTFTQLNLTEENYDLSQYSYFESEGDQQTIIKKAILEDELLNWIRIAPERIPTGNIELIPSLFHARLAHKEMKPRQARVSMNKGETVELIVEYLHFERTLTIEFEPAFPHKILSWTEKSNDNWLAGGATKAKLKKTIQSAYWEQNGAVYEELRDTLQLSF